MKKPSKDIYDMLYFLLMFNSSQYVKLLFALLVGIGLGWIAANFFGDNHQALNKGSVLREGGYKYISPLLLAEYGNGQTSEELKGLESQILDLIAKAKSNNSITIASVYMRDLEDEKQISINDNQKYYPASLNKVPLLMSVYKKAENQPELLNKKLLASFNIDYNLSQDVIPSKTPTSGQEYSIKELLEMTVIHSDNIGFHIIASQSGITEEMMDIYNELRIDYPFNELDNRDAFSAREYARLFRILYNSTYMRPESSERALQMLGQVEYANGIKAGLPKDTIVAHKFGQGSFKNNSGVIEEREFHDCGIIYAPKKPYVLCLMTKSAAELNKVEAFIANVSEAIYHEMVN